MHDHFINCPLCPESISIKKDDLNEWQQQDYKESKIKNKFSIHIGRIFSRNGLHLSPSQFPGKSCFAMTVGTPQSTGVIPMDKPCGPGVD